MGLFNFVKNAGEKIANVAGFGDEEKAQEVANDIKSEVTKHDLGVEDLDVCVVGDKVVLNGNAPDAETLEKAILAAGNINGVAQVEANIEVASAAPEPQFYEVKSGDNLSKIAKEFYGNANRYPEIFEANKPMLSHPDKIYPGQNLRIPRDEKMVA